MEKIINIFGDSIVHAGYVDCGGWADRLANYLEKREEDYFEVYNLGICGDNSEKLLKRFKIENEARTPTSIIIAIGINDSHYVNSKDNPRIEIEDFKNNLLDIIREARAFTEEIIFIGLTKVDESKVMPIPWGLTKYYDNENISLYNDKIKELCEKNNILFLEMLDLLGSDDLEDGLHPNSRGHEKMFLRIRDFLVENKII
jgi:lysophospholipase L1-like esterase